jgi:hypothetical protein
MQTECDLCPQSVIFTRMSEICTRIVWFPHAACDFHTRCVICTRRARSPLDFDTCVWLWHSRVWFRHVKVLFQHAPIIYFRYNFLNFMIYITFLLFTTFMKTSWLLWLFRLLWILWEPRVWHKIDLWSKKLRSSI